MAILNQIDVRTARLWLRPPREMDVERLYQLIANWEVMRWHSSPPWPYALEDARDFVSQRKSPSADCITAAIVLDDELIGIIDAFLKQPSALQRERGYAIGYWIGQPFWGRGYMSEAAGGFFTHVFAAIRDDVIYSGAFSDNAASLRIQEKLGFERCGEAVAFSNTHQKDMHHVNTVLTRARFSAVTAEPGGVMGSPNSAPA
jgi:RimJ/RimL family protein N-acetyltransferase